jgi:hypothetical protein
MLPEATCAAFGVAQARISPTIPARTRVYFHALLMLLLPAMTILLHARWRIPVPLAPFTLFCRLRDPRLPPVFCQLESNQDNICIYGVNRKMVR